jgi:hypothetical protein
MKINVYVSILFHISSVFLCNLYGLFAQYSFIFSAVLMLGKEKYRTSLYAYKECQEIALISPTAGR